MDEMMRAWQLLSELRRGVVTEKHVAEVARFVQSDREAAVAAGVCIEIARLSTLQPQAAAELVRALGSEYHCSLAAVFEQRGVDPKHLARILTCVPTGDAPSHGKDLNLDEAIHVGEDAVAALVSSAESALQAVLQPDRVDFTMSTALTCARSLLCAADLG